jgi:hypothetical protein
MKNKMSQFEARILNLCKKIKFVEKIEMNSENYLRMTIINLVLNIVILIILIFKM